MTHPLIQQARMMARYNRLANERLYGACGGLSDGKRRRDRKGFFRSIHGTLNHILVGDRIWLGRFQGKSMPSTGLDAILYDDFAALETARRDEDRRIEAFAAGLEDSVLASTVSYKNNQGLRFDDPVPVLLTHLFNHQTHHRGQVHDMLSQTGIEPPSLDLHRVLIPTPGSALGSPGAAPDLAPLEPPGR